MYQYNDFDTLIFDLGNTILPISPKKTITEFQNLGFESNILNPPANIKSTLEAYQKGTLTTNRFLELVKNEFPKAVTKESITKAWNAMLLEFPRENIILLQKLKDTHRLLLLSNTNELHAQCFEKKAKEQDFDFLRLFDAVYYSHEIGMSKPDKEIYKYIHGKEQLENKRVLFLDDLEENLITAHKFGWKTQQISEQTTILDL